MTCTAMTVTILQIFHACDTENTQHALNDNVSELPQICIANSHNDGLKLSWTVMESNSKWLYILSFNSTSNNISKNNLSIKKTGRISFLLRFYTSRNINSMFIIYFFSKKCKLNIFLLTFLYIKNTKQAIATAGANAQYCGVSSSFKTEINSFVAKYAEYNKIAKNITYTRLSAKNSLFLIM